MVKNMQLCLMRSLLGILFFFATTGSYAEVWAEIYGGEGFTSRHSAQVNLPDAGITGTHYSLIFNPAPIMGGRVLYWLKKFQYGGLGIDASHYFGPDQKQQVSLTKLCIIGFECTTSPEAIKKFNNDVTVIGFDALFRYPFLISEQFNNGRVQPYVNVGPALFVTTLTDTDNFIPHGQSSTYTSLGIKAGAGFMLLVTQNIGAFVEYREMNFKVMDTFYNNTVAHGLVLGKTIGSAMFNIQSVVAGASWRF